MVPQGKLGYDAPLIDRSGDDLNRWRLAKDIVGVIRSTPPDWSTRIGILGTWGEGKTTVLRYVESLLRDENDLLFKLEPWAVQSWDELWGEFGDRFSTALEDAGLPFDHSWKSSLRNVGTWLADKGVNDAATALADLFGKEKALKSSFGLVCRWLRRDGEQIRAMRESLG